MQVLLTMYEELYNFVERFIEGVLHFWKEVAVFINNEYSKSNFSLF